MPRGYMEGPAAEEAERRAEELERGPEPERPAERQAVYGSTEDDPEPHFLGWIDFSVASTKPEAALGRRAGWQPAQGRGWTLAPRDSGREAGFHCWKGH